MKEVLELISKKWDEVDYHINYLESFGSEPSSLIIEEEKFLWKLKGMIEEFQNPQS